VNDVDAGFLVKVVGGPAIVLGAMWGLIKLVGGEAYRRATAALGHIDELRTDAQRRDTQIAVLIERISNLREESDKHRESLHQVRTELDKRLSRIDVRLEDRD